MEKKGCTDRKGKDKERSPYDKAYPGVASCFESCQKTFGRLAFTSRATIVSRHVLIVIQQILKLFSHQDRIIQTFPCNGLRERSMAVSRPMHLFYQPNYRVIWANLSKPWFLSPAEQPLTIPSLGLHS